MSHKINSSLKNVFRYRSMLGFVILLCASSSAQSDALKENISYLDCSLIMNELLRPVANGIKKNRSYLIDYCN